MSSRGIPAETDVLIVGAGPGGYVAAIRAGQLDLDVTLVERDAYGGVCLNYGCIPSKALIEASATAHEAANATEMGIDADLTVDLERTQAWKRGVVEQLTGGVEKLCKANQVSLVDGLARFEDEHRARVITDGNEHRIAFDHAIVATGSRPIEIPGFSFDDEPILSSRDALALSERPDSLVVVGAGYIGMELATVFAKLGTDVQVVEMLDDVLPGFESDLSRPVKRRAKELGISFAFGEAASDWRDAGDGIEIRTETEGGDGSTYAADRVLVAVGRTPVTDTVDLEAIGLETTDRGFIETDDRARTDLEHVFAVGDVAGEPLLAHEASAAGQVAAEVIAGEPSRLDHRAIPAAVFTDPEIGTVGLTAEAAEESGFKPRVGTFPFRASGRALTTGRSDGFVRLVAAVETGRVLGGQVVGPEASELIAEIGLAIETGTTLEELGRTIHAHPTLSEAVMEAAENGLGHAIHTLNR
ncbi:dihydrolipoyl dehydrogenase [Saliphagus sp. GCM10025317]